MPSTTHSSKTRRTSVDSLTSAHERDSDYVPSDSEWDDDRAWEEADLVDESELKQHATRQRTALNGAQQQKPASESSSRRSAATRTATATAPVRKSARIQARK